jgi:transposase InsO family protein
MGYIYGNDAMEKCNSGAYQAFNDGLTVPPQPNHVWTVDFKGWFNLDNGQRCGPLTVCDLYSRYVPGCRARAQSAVQGHLVCHFRPASR